MKAASAPEPLLERNEELARIESALAEARTRRGRFLVIEGPAGIGKTALLAAARTAAAEGGMRVLRSRATEMETNFAVVGHLTSVFRKLRINSRDELPAALAGGGARVPA